MPSKKIVAPDILGFKHSMQEIIDRSGQDKRRRDELESMLVQFCGAFRDLDEFRLKVVRARSFAPGEPCFHGASPCVVLGVNNIKVTVREWTRPPVQSRNPMQGMVKTYNAKNLGKVSTQGVWDNWVYDMRMCGHYSDWWTTSEILGVAQ